jgi:hypothetical protein
LTYQDGKIYTWTGASIENAVIGGASSLPTRRRGVRGGEWENEGKGEDDYEDEDDLEQEGERRCMIH